MSRQLRITPFSVLKLGDKVYWRQALCNVYGEIVVKDFVSQYITIKWDFWGERGRGGLPSITEYLHPFGINDTVYYLTTVFTQKEFSFDGM